MTRNDSAQNHGWNPWDVVDLMVPDVVGHWMMGSWDNLREGKAPSGVMKHGESASYNGL